MNCISSSAPVEAKKKDPRNEVAQQVQTGMIKSGAQAEVGVGV